MLTEEQAVRVVVDCIRAVSHVEIVDITGSLDDAEVLDQSRVNNLVHLIVSSGAIGVPSMAHAIGDSAFNNVTTDTIVDELIEIVRVFSVPTIFSSPSLGGDSTTGSDR